MEPTIISAIKEIGAILQREPVDKPRNWNKFGWSYFNKHRGWNWLGGLTKWR